MTWSNPISMFDPGQNRESGGRAAGLADSSTGVVDEHLAETVPPTPGQAVDLVDAAIRRTGALPFTISVWHYHDGLQVSTHLSDDAKDEATGRRIFADLGAPDPVLGEPHGTPTIATLAGQVPSLGAVLRVVVRVDSATGPTAGGALGEISDCEDAS